MLKSSFEIFEIKFLLFGPKIPKQTKSSVISLNSKLDDKCFKICALSWVLVAAELIILKWFLSIQITVKSV